MNSRCWSVKLILQIVVALICNSDQFVKKNLQTIQYITNSRCWFVNLILQIVATIEHWINLCFTKHMWWQIKFDKHRKSHYQNHTNLNLKVKGNKSWLLIGWEMFVNQPIRNKDSTDHYLGFSEQLWWSRFLSY